MMFSAVPPEAVPAAVATRAALDGGATEVVLYTDLANPTRNALYPGWATGRSKTER